MDRTFGLDAGTAVWIAGSTHRGEEEMLLEAHRRLLDRVPGARLVLAPRHPERVPEVAELSRRRGFEVVRRSELPRAQSTGALIVVDTVGELASMYSVGVVAFIGGSLVPAGGRNVLEPALRGKPVLFGPHTENFRESVGLLRASGGGRVVRDSLELVTALTALMADRALWAALGPPRGASASRVGAAHETLELIRRFPGHAVRTRRVRPGSSELGDGFSAGPRRVLRRSPGISRPPRRREWLYGHGVLHSRTLSCPVVSIGNLNVGGTGKTPAVELAAQTSPSWGAASP